MLDLTIRVKDNRRSNPMFSGFDDYDCEIIKKGMAVTQQWEIPEDGEISVDLKLGERLYEYGEPVLYIGDVVHDFILDSENLHEKTWKLLFDEEYVHGTPFRNFVGKSEIVLFFKGSDVQFRSVVDIQANEVNAELAKDMLEYLSVHYEDIVSVCFSRSKISGDVGKGSDESINRLIEEAQSGIEVCEAVWPEVISRVRESWESKLESQPKVLPNSPQGIAWLSQNPEGISVCHPDDKMFELSCYPVKTFKSVKEVVIPNRDLFENKVIYGYLAHLEKTLIECEREISLCAQENGDLKGFYGYVSLDYVLNKYRRPICLGISRKLENLVLRIRLLRKKFSSVVSPPSYLKPLPPNVTPFVARTPSYLKVFEKIARWYDFGEVKIGFGDLLFGLRHLSTLYEFTILNQIISALGKNGLELVGYGWRDYNVSKFGGEPKDRPSVEVNNYFVFKDVVRKSKLELFYEPKIWTKYNAQHGDPVDVCFGHKGKGWQHRKPDYLIRIWFEGVFEPVLLILDAKFSSAYRVRKEKLPDLINKYLLGVHQKKMEGGYGQSPVQAVWAIYPKGQAEKVDFYAPCHSLEGAESLLPSLGGVKVKPNDESKLVKVLDKLLNQLALEFRKPKFVSINSQSKVDNRYKLFSLNDNGISSDELEIL